MVGTRRLLVRLAHNQRLTIHSSRTRFVASFNSVVAGFLPIPAHTLRVGLIQALAAMTVARQDMLKALAEHAIPQLRALGFKGSMPHFYRDRENHIDLLTFQFSQWGGRLVAEAAFAEQSRANVIPHFKDAPPAKLRAAATGQRLRLGQGSSKRDPWFIYDQPVSGEVQQEPVAIAQALSHLIAGEGVVWWDAQRATSS